jgi:hypothetical protein
MKNTKGLYLQLVQAFDLSTTDRQETPQLYQAKSNASSKPEDILNKIDLVNKG